MSKAKFEAAKDLIKQGDYQKARALLNTIDHPLAQEWLDKLDQRERKEPTSAANPSRPPSQSTAARTSAASKPAEPTAQKEARTTSGKSGGSSSVSAARKQRATAKPANTTEQKRGRSLLLPIVGVVALAALIAVGVLVVLPALNGGDDDETPTQVAQAGDDENVAAEQEATEENIATEEVAETPEVTDVPPAPFLEQTPETDAAIEDRRQTNPENPDAPEEELPDFLRQQQESGDNLPPAFPGTGGEGEQPALPPGANPEDQSDPFGQGGGENGQAPSNPFDGNDGVAPSPFEEVIPQLEAALPTPAPPDPNGQPAQPPQTLALTIAQAYTEIEGFTGIDSPIILVGEVEQDGYAYSITITVRVLEGTNTQAKADEYLKATTTALGTDEIDLAITLDDLNTAPQYSWSWQEGAWQTP